MQVLPHSCKEFTYQIVNKFYTFSKRDFNDFAYLALGTANAAEVCNCRSIVAKIIITPIGQGECMSFEQQAPKANWNLVRQRDNIRVYISDKGHMKVARLTEKGLEQIVAMFSGRDLETLVGVNDLLVAAQQDLAVVHANKEKNKAQEYANKMHAQALEKVAKQIQAARDAMLAAGISLDEVNRALPLNKAS